MLRYVFHPIHPAAWPFVAVAVVLTVGLGMVHGALTLIGLAGVAFCLYFFRDPHRTTPTRSGLVVAPADGVITAIEQAAPPPEMDMPGERLTRVSTFLSVLDVHVNRIPCDGQVVRSVYHPGRFFNAALDKASDLNERHSVRLLTPEGKTVVFVQIAGLIARRIICDLEEGQQVRAGERFGLIRFGSRVDVYLPPDTNPLVAIGQHTLGGETVLADFLSNEPARHGEER